MIPTVIKNEADYEAALARVDELMDADPGTPEGDQLKLLVTLVELYEQKVYPIGFPDQIEEFPAKSTFPAGLLAGER